MVEFGCFGAHFLNPLILASLLLLSGFARPNHYITAENREIQIAGDLGYLAGNGCGRPNRPATAWHEIVGHSRYVALSQSRIIFFIPDAAQ